MYNHCLWGFYVCLCFLALQIILARKRKLVALLLLPFGCPVTVNVLTVSWVGLQFVIVVFPDHTHLLIV